MSDLDFKCPCCGDQMIAAEAALNRGFANLLFCGFGRSKSADACTDCGYLEFYLETPSAFADRVELETSKEPAPQSSKPS